MKAAPAVNTADRAAKPAKPGKGQQKGTGKDDGGHSASRSTGMFAHLPQFKVSHEVIRVLDGHIHTLGSDIKHTCLVCFRPPSCM